ncbi:MAG: hypothetical protein IJS12_06160 [Lachnospiraceae bacterium]|nr:hypothetical protein [Lachnospiraceae bacterium]
MKKIKEFTGNISIILILSLISMSLVSCGKKPSITDVAGNMTQQAADQENNGSEGDGNITENDQMPEQDSMAKVPEDPAKAAEREAIHEMLKENGTFYEAYWNLTDTLVPGYKYKAPDHKWDDTPWESQGKKFRKANPNIKESDVTGKYVLTSQTFDGVETDYSYMMSMDEAYNSTIWIEEGTVGLLNRFGQKMPIRWNMDGWINMGLPDSATWELKDDELHIKYNENTWDVYTRIQTDDTPPVIELPLSQETKEYKEIEGRVYRLTRIVDPEAATYTDGHPGWEECDPFGTILESSDDNLIVFTDEGYGFRRMNGEDFVFYYLEDRDYYEAGINGFFKGVQGYAYSTDGVNDGLSDHYEINGSTLRVYRTIGFNTEIYEDDSDFWNVYTYDTWYEYELTDETSVVTRNPDIGMPDSWDEMIIPPGDHENAGLWEMSFIHYLYDPETVYVDDYKDAENIALKDTFTQMGHGTAIELTGDEVRAKGKNFYINLQEDGRGWVHVFGKDFPLMWSNEGIFGYDISGKFCLWDGSGTGDGYIDSYTSPAFNEFSSMDYIQCSQTSGSEQIQDHLKPFLDVENAVTEQAYVSVDDTGSWFGDHGLNLVDKDAVVFPTTLYENGKESGISLLEAWVNTAEGTDSANYLAGDGKKLVNVNALIDCLGMKDDLYINVVPFDRYTGISMAQSGGEVFHCSMDDPMITEPGGYHAEMYTKTIDINGKPTDIEIIKSWGWTNYTDYDEETKAVTEHERIFSISYSLTVPEDYYGTLFQFSGSTKSQAEANEKLDYSRTGTTTIDATPYFSSECAYFEPETHAAATN